MAEKWHKKDVKKALKSIVKIRGIGSRRLR